MGLKDVRRPLFRTARRIAGMKEREYGEKGGKEVGWISSKTVAVRGIRARATTTKIRAARHFLRGGAVELLDMQPRRLASYGHY